jgi:hypothetical protein
MKNENIDAILEASRPRLTTEERERVWQKVAAEIATPEPVLSPYWNFVVTMPVTPFIIALMLVLGAGGTVAVAEAAKPGDILFPLDRAAERARLALASDDTERALRSQFADERLAELRAILDEEAVGLHDDSSLRAVSGKRAPITNLQIEVDVFTDTTVVKVEQNDVKTRFTTNATAKEAIVAEIMNRYGYTVSEVTAALRFEIEDRASRPSERGGVINSNLGEARVGIAVNALLDELDDMDDYGNRGRLIAALLREINGVVVSGRDTVPTVPAFTNNARIKIDDDRIEIRENGYRVRFESDDKDDDSDDDRSEGTREDDSRDEVDFDDSDFRDERNDDRNNATFEEYDDSDGRNDDAAEDSGDDRDEDRSGSDDDRYDDDDSSGKGSGDDDSETDEDDEADDDNEDEDDDLSN